MNAALVHGEKSSQNSSGQSRFNAPGRSIPIFLDGLLNRYPALKLLRQIRSAESQNRSLCLPAQRA